MGHNDIDLTKYIFYSGKEAYPLTSFLKVPLIKKIRTFMVRIFFNCFYSISINAIVFVFSTSSTLWAFAQTENIFSRE